MDLVSVIVPIYNVEFYLNRCIESITQQSYKNLEIILVDDGSPDRCSEICDKWAKKDGRIKVIHKVNGGLSDARNAGLKVSTGEYIAFVDSDDWVHKEYIMRMYKALKEYSADISACDILEVYKDDKLEDARNFSVKCYSTEDALETLIKGNTFRAVVWNKLYHKNVLKNESFELGKYHEDEFFTYKILAKSKKCVFVDAKMYFYFQREGSIMNTISSKHLDVLEAYVERIEFLHNNYPRLFKIDKTNFCVSCIYYYQKSFNLPKSERKKCRNKIKICRAKIHFDITEFKEHSLKEKIYILGSGILINVVSHVLSWRGIVK